VENFPIRTTPDLLDAAKQRLGLTSDYALAKALKWPTSNMSAYRCGRRSMDLVQAAEFEEVTGIPMKLAALAAKGDREYRRQKHAA
jgi:hypothetical protein